MLTRLSIRDIVLIDRLDIDFAFGLSVLIWQDLFGIKIRGVEERFSFIAITPFFVREGVDGEMNESVELELMPTQLAC